MQELIKEEHKGATPTELQRYHPHESYKDVLPTGLCHKYCSVGAKPL